MHCTISEWDANYLENQFPSSINAANYQKFSL